MIQYFFALYLLELYNYYDEEELQFGRQYSDDDQPPQRSKTGPRKYFIKESNYERSPSVVEEDESPVYEVYPDTLENSQFSRRSYETTGNFIIIISHISIRL